MSTRATPDIAYSPTVETAETDTVTAIAINNEADKNFFIFIVPPSVVPIPKTAPKSTYSLISENDINDVFIFVDDTSKIKIEEIQDLIEESLQKKNYNEVYVSFKEYRDRRNQSRDMFVDDKRMHKFLKTIEGLGLKTADEDDTKRENANVDGDGPMGTMLHFGSTVSREFAKAYLSGRYGGIPILNNGGSQ